MSIHFHYFPIISPWNGRTNINCLMLRILCANFGWNWSSSSEEDENVKSLQWLQPQQWKWCRKTTGKLWSETLTWAELMLIKITFIMNQSFIRTQSNTAKLKWLLYTGPSISKIYITGTYVLNTDYFSLWASRQKLGVSQPMNIHYFPCIYLPVLSLPSRGRPWRWNVDVIMHQIQKRKSHTLHVR